MFKHNKHKEEEEKERGKNIILIFFITDKEKKLKEGGAKGQIKMTKENNQNVFEE